MAMEIDEAIIRVDNHAEIDEVEPIEISDDEARRVRLYENFYQVNAIDPALYAAHDVKRGLRNADGTGVLAGMTNISNVHGYVMSDGEKMPAEGSLRLRGYDLYDLLGDLDPTRRFAFEEVAYLLLMGLALPLGILAAAAAYQFTRRADLSIVLFIAFCALSLTVWAAEWQLCWLNPCVWALSDDFSNLRVFRSVAWMRLAWLAALAGVWTVSYLCIRQYGKGVFGSLARSVRRLYRPVIALALLACSGAAYAAQPFIDHSNPDLTVMSFYEIPYAEGVTFVRRTAQVFPDTDAGTVTGRASYQFQNTSGQEQSVSFGINPGYAISNVKANGADVPFTVSDYQEYNEALLEVTIPAEEEVELTMEYSGFKAVSMAAKDCGAPARYVIQGNKGYILQKSTANFCGGVTFHPNQGKEEHFNLNGGRPRQAAEFEAFARAIESGDQELCARMQDTSIAVSRVLTVGRRSAGVKFPGER